MQVEINDHIEKIIISSEAVLVFYKDKVLKNYKKHNNNNKEYLFLSKTISPFFVRVYNEIENGFFMERLGERIGQVEGVYSWVDKEKVKQWLLLLESELDRLEVAHGDIKPVNIVKSGDSYKLIDFTSAIKKEDVGYDTLKEKDRSDIKKIINEL